jgi:hypothetical protein
MARWTLKDADIHQLAICKVGANRQRVFLLKSDDDERKVAMIAPLYKAGGEDWTTAYVPVAVPGSAEGQGMFGTGHADEDVWDEDEIRKAAHSFLRNGGRVVAKHFDSAVAPGISVVESTVALADMEVEGPDGPHQIAKGTWYVGLNMEGEARELVNRGEIDAVSVEGLAERVLAKAETFSKPGTADVTPSDAKKITPLARHYLKMAHPFTSCVRDQVSHGLSPDHAKRRCAVLLDYFDPARARHSNSKLGKAEVDALWDDGAVTETLDRLADDPKLTLMQRIAKALGIPTAADASALLGESGTLGDVEIGERVEQLEGRINGLEEKLVGTDDKPGLVAKIASDVGRLAKETPENPPPDDGNGNGNGDDGNPPPSTETPDTREDKGQSRKPVAKMDQDELEKHLDRVAEQFAGAVEPVAARLAELREQGPKPASVEDRLAKLEQGDSTQQETNGQPVAKSGSPMAGILFD